MFTLHPNQRFPDNGYMLCGEPVWSRAPARQR